ncbi:MAG: replication initiation factor domain-containing protein [Pseudohongiellaceae bacterium]
MVAPTAKRISRVDLAVTVELPKPDPRLAQRGWDKNATATERQYAMIQNSKNGKTLYVGSRQSDQYGRLYDKGVKDLGREPGEVWRYEIELKSKPKNMALLQSMYDRWRLHGIDSADVTQYVHQWFAVRGVSPKFSARGKGMPRPDLEATVMTAEKKLRWLSQQVRPTITALIDAGLGDAAIRALGLEAEQLPFWSDDVLDGSARQL